MGKWNQFFDCLHDASPTAGLTGKRSAPALPHKHQALLFTFLAIVLISGGSCKPAAERTAAEAKYLAGAKDWGKKVVSQLDNTEIYLTTNWQEGKLSYKVSVSPYHGNFDRYIRDTLAENKLEVHLEDMSGLNLLTIEAPLNKMSLAKGEKGAEALQATGKIRCTKQMYNAIADWSVSWSFPLRH